MFANFSRIYPLGERPDYEPLPSTSVEAIAERDGCAQMEVIYDLMLDKDGKAILYYPNFNYSYGHLDHLHEMLQHPGTVNSLSDGGAHCGYICEVSMPTFMLSHWTRDRTRGAKLRLKDVVKRQTLDTARVYGLQDRGALKPGMKADLNVIDYDRLRLYAPEMVFDLPVGGHHLIQHADGSLATVVAGKPIFENRQATGELRGKAA
ncbi:MAG: amidohydrolase family protein [Candidatus Protistobacter heckmanni]|nr:amidohydrolase family protein [Candidatus Protistobacter heckmanni]